MHYKYHYTFLFRENISTVLKITYLFMFFFLFFFLYSLQADRNTLPKKGLEYVITVTVNICLKTS